MDASRASVVEVAPRSLKRAELLARRIVQDIKRQRLGPGHTLPSEAEMITSYAVGRATLREALRLLEVQGLISMKPGPGGGPIVTRLTPRHFADMAKLHLQMVDASYRELARARLAIEPLMARLAASNTDRDAAARLQAVIERGERVDLADDDAYLAAALDFHAMIAGISGNRVLDLFGVALKEIMDAGVRPVFAPKTDRAQVREAHEAIAHAVLRGDEQAAEDLMRAHMEHFMSQVEFSRPEFLDSGIEWS